MKKKEMWICDVQVELLYRALRLLLGIQDKIDELEEDNVEKIDKIVGEAVDKHFHNLNFIKGVKSTLTFDLNIDIEGEVWTVPVRYSEEDFETWFDLPFNEQAIVDFGWLNVLMRNILDFLKRREGNGDDK